MGIKGKQTLFFADLTDMQPVFKDIEAHHEVLYYQAGLHDSPKILKYTSMLNNEGLGKASNGDWNHLISFLVIPRNTELIIEKVPQRKGGLKFAVDQMLNKKSVYVRTGGVYTNGILVGSQISTISEEAFSLEFYKDFISLIKKNFKKIGTSYVGKSALEKLNTGWRLVTNDKSPQEYDLKI